MRIPHPRNSPEALVADVRSPPQVLPPLVSSRPPLVLRFEHLSQPPTGAGPTPDELISPEEADNADVGLAGAAATGDAQALSQLWNRNRRWIAAILIAHKPKWADVEDLLQEVALSMVRKLSEIRDPRAVRPWLRTVAINIAHAAARSGKRRAADERMGDSADDYAARASSATGDNGASVMQGADNVVQEQEQGRNLMELSARLPDGYREPLLLKAVQGLSYREIGEIMSLPETTIETRIARGRRMLRELASPKSGPSEPSTSP